jgi:DNA polymerase III epsilon subunit-like protein
MSILFLDLETDGVINPKGNFSNQKIIQMCYQIHDIDNKLLIKINDFIKGVDFVKDIEGMNRVSVEFLNENGIELKDGLEKLVRNIDLYNVDKIVCHNTEFDLTIINRELKNFNLFIKKDIEEICTQKNDKIRRFCNLPNLKWPRLIELAKILDIDLKEDKLHDASYDVDILQKCFTKLIEKNVKFL